MTSNYRWISITSCLGKLFSEVLCKRLYNEIETHNLISKSQIGFVKGKRTSDHIFVLKSIIEEYKSKKRPVYACFVDLTNAYDTIWRDGLSRVLERIDNDPVKLNGTPISCLMYADDMILLSSSSCGTEIIKHTWDVL